MSLKDVELKKEYRSLLDNVVQDFYIPLLKDATLYQRAVGFFSSSSLVEISKGIAAMAEAGGKIQIVASPYLSDEDIEAIKKGYADRDKIAIPDISEAFMKHAGWTRYLPVPYFVKAGEEMTERFRDCTIKGMTIAASGFYGPQGRVLRMPLAIPDMVEKFESFRFNGWRVTNFEMEGSAIAGIAAHLGHNAGTVCCIIANRHLKSSNPDYKPYIRQLVELVLDRLTR